MNTINRLQFRHHSEIFDTREAAVEYIQSQIRFAEEGLAKDDPSYGYSLFGEPTVLLYKNEEDESDPHLIIAIGSVTNNGTQYLDNRFCIIDINKTESEIEDLWEELEKVINSLTIVTRDTNTLKLHSEKTDDGTVLSGDVVVAESHIFDNVRLPNRLMATESGLYTYVNLTYDEDRETFTFVVNNAETGELEKTSIKLENNYVVSGEYSVEDESLHLVMRDGTEIAINLEQLIDEWYVEGEASRTPIVLTREEVGYGDEAAHNHVEPWQDVLRADVRIADMTHNILKKTSDGRYLYVRGMADNIAYFKDGVEISVADALNECARKKVSSDNNNIIYEKPDGIFATATLKYVSNENTLLFTASNSTGGTNTERIELNSVEVLENMYYDSTREVLVITYIDNHGDTKFVEIPIGEMLVNWEWDIENDGHNVKLHKERVIGGNDKVSADAAIYDDPENILVDKNHELFVKGTADNIKYGRNSTVEEELDKLIASDTDINSRLDETSGKVDSVRADLDAEIARSTSEDERLDNKLEALSAKTDSEILRATTEEQRIENKFDDALGEGFDIRNSVRDEFDKEKSEREAADNFLSGAIDTLSASTEAKLADVVNTDHSIDIDKTDAVRPIISVNLSEEIEDNKPNIIKLNADGLYAGVDLIYEFNEETGSNQLIFKTTNGTKVYNLKTNSVVDKIYYDPTIESIIIEYTVNGHRMPDVVIPVGDLIDEWRVSDNTNGAIKLYKTRESGATQDVLYAESIISNHNDNIIVNDSGALYVSGSQIQQNKDNIEILSGRVENVGSTLQTAINNEVTRATNAENALQTSINNEVTRATNAESTLQTAISNEVTRATNAENVLQTAIGNEATRATSEEQRIEAKLDQEIERSTAEDERLDEKINAEKNERVSADTELRNNIHNEIIRATNAENTLSTNLAVETQRSRDKDVELDNSLAAETAAREAADGALQDAINAATHSLESTTTIRVDKENPASWKAYVTTSSADKNIIISHETNGGIFATAELVYDAPTNTIKLMGTNGILLSQQKLGAGSLLDSIDYDPTEKNLIITYHTADGVEQILQFGVAELFNEWDVRNPSEGSALELTKVPNSGETGAIDYIYGRVLLTKAIEIDGGGVEYGDNMIRIVNNGLYVSSSAITSAQEGLECAIEEIKSLEETLGVSGNCSDVIQYPTTEGCLLSSATTYAEADAILETSLCNLLNMMNGSDTPTASIALVQEEDDQHLEVNVRLSHGNEERMTDGDLIVSNIDNAEFTDTNVLREVALENYTPESKFNGIYLSNEWSCGEYTENGVGTPGDKYKIDDTESAQNIFYQKFRNGVRYR